jgi:hypothetical protein
VFLLALPKRLLVPLALGDVPQDRQVLPGQEPGRGPELGEADRPVRAAQRDLALHPAAFEELAPRRPGRVLLPFGDEILELRAEQLLPGSPQQLARRGVGVHVLAVVGGHQDGVQGAVEQGAQRSSRPLAFAKPFPFRR